MYSNSFFIVLFGTSVTNLKSYFSCLNVCFPRVVHTSAGAHEGQPLRLELTTVNNHVGSGN